MANGPGKFDRHAQRVMREEFADCVILIVTGSRRGAGVSIKTSGATPEIAKGRHMKVPDILRVLADNIEAQIEFDLATAEPDPEGGISA